MVLIYEVGVRANSDWTALGFADLTIIGGAFLPTRSLKAQGIATVLLMDVISGYPYGTAQAEADLSELSTSYGTDARLARLRNQVSEKVLTALTPEVQEMFNKLLAAHAAAKG